MKSSYPHDILCVRQFIKQGLVYLMKSSTLRRSNLSKEKMAVLEALSSYRRQGYDSNTPSVYVRPSKEKELDILWQNFKINQKSEKSPSVYLGIGFVAGAVSMLILMALVGFSAKGITSDSESVPAPAKVKSEKVKLNFIPSNAQEQVANEGITSSPKANETYTVKNGDTMGAILVRFYGAETRENRIKVMNANGIKNPNKISIGQKLIIPMGQ